MSVVRVQKKKKDFFQAKNECLNQKGLSFKAKGLWAYAMSRPDDWQFIVEHLITVSKEKKTAIYAAIKELIKSGYCLRDQRQTDKGRWDPTDYIIFETLEDAEEFKKSLPRSGFPQADYPQAENQPLLSIEEETHTKKKEKYIPPGAARLASLFLETVLKTVPDLKKPDIDIWAYEFDKLTRLDGRTLEKCEELIRWLPSNEFWASKILKAKKFREHFDSLSAEMNKKSKSNGNVIENISFSKKIIEKFPELNAKNHIQLQDNGLLFCYGNVYDYPKFDDKAFKELVLSRLNKMNLSTNGI